MLDIDLFSVLLKALPVTAFAKHGFTGYLEQNLEKQLRPQAAALNNLLAATQASVESRWLARLAPRPLFQI